MEPDEPDEQTCDCGAVVTQNYWDCYCYFELPASSQVTEDDEY